MKSLSLALYLLTTVVQIVTLDGFAHTVHVRVLSDNDFEEWNFHGLPDNSLRFIKKKATTPVDYTNLSKSDCNSRIEEVKKRSGQVAMMIDLGHRAVLPCHRCTPKTEKAMNWYKLIRQVSVEGNIVVWRPLEVRIDKYDDERLNRVFVKPNHQLVIDDFQPNDVGSYFCEAYDKITDSKLKGMLFRAPNNVGTGAAGIASAWKSISGSKVDVIVHVDVETPKKESLVTASGVGYPKPLPEFVDVRKNIKVFTQWEAWGDCNACGSRGIKRRRGSCFVKRFKTDRSSRPAHLDHTLELFPEGAPCQSSLFTSRDMSSIVSRSPEVEIAVCQLKCPGKSRNSSGLLDMNISSRKKKTPVRRQTLSRVEGDYLELKCPGAKDDSPVLWKRNKRVLNSTMAKNSTMSKKSSTSVKIDAFNKLIFSKILMRDANKYKCYINMTKRAVYIVQVLPSPIPKEDLMPYFRYLILSFAVDTVIFLVLLVVRHKHRLVQVQRKENSMKRRRRRRRKRRTIKKKKKDTSSDSSSSSDSSATDSKRSPKGKRGRGRGQSPGRGRGVPLRGRGGGDNVGRGGAPAGRGASPRGRGVSPRGRGASPRGRGASPRGRGASPRGRGADAGRGASPRGRGAAPGRGASPRGRGAAPAGRGDSPRGRGSNPPGRGGNVVGRGDPRGRGANVRGRGAAVGRGGSPRGRGASPAKRGGVSRGRGASPRGRGASPRGRGGRGGGEPGRRPRRRRRRRTVSSSSASSSSSGTKGSSDISD